MTTSNPPVILPSRISTGISIPLPFVSYSTIANGLRRQLRVSLTQESLIPQMPRPSGEPLGPFP